MTRVTRWRFAALEFRVLWESTGRDVLPYPLQHRTTRPYRDEFDRDRQAAARVVHPQLDDELLLAVQVLLAPEARVEVAGFKGPNSERKIRGHAGVHYQHGAVVIQQSGSDHQHGGDVQLSLMPAEQVAPAIVSALPNCAPGQHKPLRIPVDDLDKPRPVFQDSWNPTPQEELERFFNRPTTGSYYVAVYPRGSVDNRHINGRKDFQITDFTNDGRYVSFGSNIVTAKPADDARITATMQQMITRTVDEVRSGDHPAL